MKAKKNYQLPQTTVTAMTATHMLMVSGEGESPQTYGNVNNIPEGGITAF